MRNDAPLAALQRRLGLAATPDGDSDDDDAALAPSWVPDGRPARRDWLAAVRADPGRAGTIALAAVAALAVLITVFTLIRSHPAPVVSAKLPPVQTPVSGAAAATTSVPPAATRVVVSVVGLVKQPGLVTLAPGARIADAVSAAGGTIRGADTLGLNLARHVEDGEQIVVGIATPSGRTPVLGSSVGTPSVGIQGQGPAAASSTPAAPTAPVDLNTATAGELDALPGVGPVTAAAILAWRAANGRFTSVDQLGEVDGIGPARLERLRPLVRV